MTEVRHTSETGGMKNRKPQMLSALDPAALWTLAEVAGMGAEKYDAHNYLKGYPWSWSYDAMQRHLMQFWSGENDDAESGLPHVAHAAWHCLALLSFLQREIGTDDRPPVAHVDPIYGEAWDTEWPYDPDDDDDYAWENSAEDRVLEDEDWEREMGDGWVIPEGERKAATTTVNPYVQAVDDYVAKLARLSVALAHTPAPTFDQVTPDDLKAAGWKEIGYTTDDGLAGLKLTFSLTDGRCGVSDCTACYPLKVIA